MPEPTIGVVVTDDGAITFDTAGFEGRACLAATDRLQAQLRQTGLELAQTAQHPKPELALEPGATQRQRITQG